MQGRRKEFQRFKVQFRLSCDQISTVILSVERGREASSFGVEGPLPSWQLQECDEGILPLCVCVYTKK
jgi:hypothetical protein